MRRARDLSLVLMSLLCLALVACTPAQSAENVETTPQTNQTPSDKLVPLNQDGSGELEGVGIGPYGAYGTTPGTPDDKASQRGQRLAVWVFDSLRGIETHLIVPMYYDDSTTYSFRGTDESVPVTQVIEDKSVVWWAAPAADVKFHLEDGVMILDTIVVNRPH